MSIGFISSVRERTPGQGCPAFSLPQGFSTVSSLTHISSETSIEDDFEKCRRQIVVGSRSFHSASLLLPRPIRRDVYALYAFCRTSDDLVDIAGAGEQEIRTLRDRLDLIFAGRPADSSIDRALADVVARHALPYQAIAALIEGMEWDTRGFSCDTFEDVLAYSTRVAGSVGAMMAVLMGATSRSHLDRACDLGIAMQITNIVRDIGEDARNGRLYIPRAWFRDAGVDADAWLRSPVWTPLIAAFAQRLLGEADRLYCRADAGIAVLPARCRPAILSARLIYADIGRVVAARGYDSVNFRARVPGRRKLRLLAEACLRSAFLSGGAASEPAVAQATYLLEAIVREQPRRPAPRSHTHPVLWVAELFAALAQRERTRGVV